MTDQIEPTPAESTGRPLVVRVAQLSDVGRVRSENQDFAILSAPADEVDRSMGRLLLVADGMGGHRGGATASRMAATITKDEYFRDGSDDIPAVLTRALERANARIWAESQVNPELRGMGTTCSALVIRGREGFLAHVGDSRIYLIRAGAISQLTDDHSLVASMVREGLLTSQEAEVHPRRNVLQRSMGVGQSVEIDARGPFEVYPGDTFVLCSDGLHGLVRPEEILQLAQLGIEDAARELVNLALERGAPDNVTVVVGRAEEINAEELEKWQVAAREERERTQVSLLAPTEELEIHDQSEVTTQRMVALPDEVFAEAEDDISEAPTAPLPSPPPARAAEPPAKAPLPPPPVREAAPRGSGGGWLLGAVIVLALAAALAWVFLSSK
ncbi:MAG: Stp1/IreP family PP2C-type Ser/Thr phosphatase [Acidobacteria bacterium]|nr:Stp1/IreP family PP2C-type Ser/Thr phosphatase [Acidobacteriota bacterium]